MSKLRLSFALLLLLWLTRPNLSTYLPISMPDCRTKCGNVTVPYPFGIGLDGACSLSTFYVVNCNESFTPPRLFIRDGNLEIMEITDTEMRVKQDISWRCFRRGNWTNDENWIDLHAFPLVFSDTANKFTAVGCNTLATIQSSRGRNLTSGCFSVCSSLSDVINGSCSGIGCCQTSIPKGLKNLETYLTLAFPDSNVSSFSPCSYAFLGEENKFRFNSVDLYESDFYNRTSNGVPVVLDWYIGDHPTCDEAKRNMAGYACQRNTQCTDFESGDSRGYRCTCLPGYEGNPYLTPGCTDINECLLNTSCSYGCINTDGSFACSCPKGYTGDGRLGRGSICVLINKSSKFATRFSLGMSFGLLVCVACITLIYFGIKRKKLTEMREKFFEQNGGLLLKQQLSADGRNKESFRIYSSEEVRAITDNYSQGRILGEGGYGIVYKGLLKDSSEVAVKVSKVVDKSQIEQFINELAILTQVNHRNVVKLFGCCLETQVPVLIYEYIPNGTLFDHIHRLGGPYWLTWRNCVKLASEAADALSYLHSEASIPIIHRDVKSSNILIDDSSTAKISDFGASRLIPLDETQVATSVLGTVGYLDPEYLQTSQLTEKSDVYSFGVLLVELVTRKKPLCLQRKIEERNFAAYFLLSMKQDRLLEILDPQLVTEATEEQLFSFAKLVQNCLNVKGEDRPTMKEVAVRLEGLKNQITHPWDEQSYEESKSLLGQQDLYPMSSGDQNHSTGEPSGTSNSLQQQHMLMEMSLLR